MQGWNNYDWALDAVKWGADFLAVATEPDRHVMHIGDIGADHAYIGRAEFYPDIDRKITMAGKGAHPTLDGAENPDAVQKILMLNACFAFC